MPMNQLKFVTVFSRELGFQIKGVQMSFFTPDEVNFLAQHGNRVVNCKYLASLTAEDITELPTGSNNNDKSQLVSFITMKYLDKKWFQQKTLADISKPPLLNGQHDSDHVHMKVSQAVKSINSNVLMNRTHNRQNFQVNDVGTASTDRGNTSSCDNSFKSFKSSELAPRCDSVAINSTTNVIEHNAMIDKINSSHGTPLMPTQRVWQKRSTETQDLVSELTSHSSSIDSSDGIPPGEMIVKGQRSLDFQDFDNNNHHCLHQNNSNASLTVPRSRSVEIPVGIVPRIAQQLVRSAVVNSSSGSSVQSIKASFNSSPSDNEHHNSPFRTNYQQQVYFEHHQTPHRGTGTPNSANGLRIGRAQSMEEGSVKFNTFVKPRGVFLESTNNSSNNSVANTFSSFDTGNRQKSNVKKNFVINHSVPNTPNVRCPNQLNPSTLVRSPAGRLRSVANENQANSSVRELCEEVDLLKAALDRELEDKKTAEENVNNFGLCDFIRVLFVYS
jgi:hypothetical protein